MVSRLDTEDKPAIVLEKYKLHCAQVVSGQCCPRDSVV
jgi:hypothetical protein